MKAVIIFLTGFFALGLLGCGGSATQDSESAGKTEYVAITKDVLEGRWECTRFVFDTGMENEMMARSQSDLLFTGDNVAYMNQTYEYVIEDNRVIVEHNGQSVLQPIAYDGNNLIMLGDNANLHYEKQE